MLVNYDVYDNLNFLGTALWFLFCFELWADGGSGEHRWNLWNPIVWFIMPIIIIAIVLIGGIPSLAADWQKNKLHLSVSDYWKRQNNIKFISRREIIKEIWNK